LQPDLFTTPDPHELEYARLLHESAIREEEYRIDNGIIPNWIESDFLLDKAERRLLELIDEHAGYVMRDDDWYVVDYRNEGNRRVSGLTVALGMNAEANSRAVVNAALIRGLVTVTRSNIDGGNRLDMTKRGRYYLDLVSDNEWWETDEVGE